MRAAGSIASSLGPWLMLVALAGCFSDGGPGDGETTLTTAAGSSAGTTGSDTDTLGSTDADETTANVSSSEGTTAATVSATTEFTTNSSDTGASTDTSSGTDTEGGAACKAPDDCDSDEFCDFPDLFCGEASAGVCQPRPSDCQFMAIVHGCDCVIYESVCHAHAAGVDQLGLSGDC